LTSNRFFIKRKNIKFPFAYVDGEEHHHLKRVARIQPHENVWLFDDKGLSYFAQVDEVGRERTKFLIKRIREKDEPNIKITLAQTLLKTKTMELVLQKSTELGAMRIIPVITSRSIVKVEQKGHAKMDRWKRITIEASKQCGRATLPVIFPPTPLERFFNERNETERLFLNERGGKDLKDILCSPSDSAKYSVFPPSSVIILIGPEGGWTDKEEHDILDCGFKAVGISRQVLRAETAAISALAMISHFWDREDVSPRTESR